MVTIYIFPQNKVITFLDELSDEALKKEATSEAKSDTFSIIMKVSRVWSAGCGQQGVWSGRWGGVIVKDSSGCG